MSTLYKSLLTTNLIVNLKTRSKTLFSTGIKKSETLKWELYIFSDMYPGHPGAINDMVAVTDNIVITGRQLNFKIICWWITREQKGRDLNKNWNKYLLFIDLSAPNYMLKYTLFIAFPRMWGWYFKSCLSFPT